MVTMRSDGLGHQSQRLTPDRDLALAHRLVDAASRAGLAHFRHYPAMELKPDGTPVSIADLEAERAMLAILADERPDDQILSEETGLTGRLLSPRQWILDPIDGTTSFLSGARAWGPHVALSVEGRLSVAVIARPTEHRRWWAVRGGGTWTDGRSGPRRLTVSAAASLPDAKFGGLTEPGSAVVAALSALTTWVEDPVSPIAALLERRLDVVLDDAGDPWDQAPAVLLVSEANGCFRDPEGGSRWDQRWGVYSNDLLMESLLEVLAPFLPEGPC